MNSHEMTPREWTGDDDLVQQYLAGIKGDLLSGEDEQRLGHSMQKGRIGATMRALARGDNTKEVSGAISESVVNVLQMVPFEIAVKYANESAADNSGRKDRLVYSFGFLPAGVEELAERRSWLLGQDKVFAKWEEEGKRYEEKLFISNLRLVVSIAKNHMGRGMELLDIIQEGNIGLIQAVNKFDYTRGFKFSTYATWWIKQAMMRAIANKSGLIRVPTHLREEIFRQKRAVVEFKAKHGRSPTTREIAELLGIKEEVVIAQNEVFLRTAVTSLNIRVNGERGDDNVEFGTTIADVDAQSPEDAALQADMADVLMQALARIKISRRNREIIINRFGLNGEAPMKLKDISERFDVTIERIRQIESAVLKKLRKDDFIKAYLFG